MTYTGANGTGQQKSPKEMDDTYCNASNWNPSHKCLAENWKPPLQTEMSFHKSL